jgi:maltose-binding protein MalE
MWWALLAVVLTACGQNLGEPSRDRLGELQGKLSLWHPFERENAQIFDSFLNNFLQLHPEIDLVSESIPPSQIMGRFTQQQNAGLGPGAMVAFARHIPEMVEKKQIQAIDNNALNFSDFLPPTRFQAQYRRQIYGIPLASNLRVLCYNSAKLKNQTKNAKKEDKTSIQPPKTLAELVARSRQG